MANKVGTLIKEARTGANMTQEQLARKIKGLSAAELAKAERGETELTQAILKEIAKTTGVTQSSLLAAAKDSAPARKTTAAKTTAAKTSAAKKTTAAAKTSTAKKTTAAAKTSAAKKTTAAAKTTAAKKTSAAKKASGELTAAEKKLLEAYREATADNKKLALKILKGEGLDLGDMMGQFKLDGKEGGGDLLSGIKDGLLGGLLGKK